MHRLYCPQPSLICFGDEVQFTPEQQAKVNAILAEDKRSLRGQLSRAEQQVAELAESKNLTEQELAESRQQLRIREENERRESAKLKKEAAEQKKRADEIEAKHKDASIKYALHDAAVAENAHNPSILAQYLRGRTSVDEQGNIVVDMPAKDGEKDIIERLSPADAVRRMRAMPDKFGGMFREFVTSQAAAPLNRNGKIDVTSLSDDEFFRQWKSDRSKLDL